MSRPFELDVSDPDSFCLCSWFQFGRDVLLPDVIRFGLFSSVSDASSLSCGTGVVYGEPLLASFVLGLKVGMDVSLLAPSDWLVADAVGPLEDDGSPAWFAFVVCFPKVIDVD